MKLFLSILFGFSILCSGFPMAVTSGQPQASTSTLVHDGGFSAFSSGLTSSSHYQNRAGYVGQLTDVEGLKTYPDPAINANEGTGLPILTALLNDDGTTTEFSDPATNYEILSGPIEEINQTPLAILQNVFENTEARYQASYLGITAEGVFTVINTDPDNFGSYASDGLSDDWQIGFFGFDNPYATSEADPDHDGQPNLFEELSGYSPIDASERLRFKILSLQSETQEATLFLSQAIPTTRYLTQSSLDLGIADSWSVIDINEPDEIRQPFTFKVPASDPTRFFRILLERR